MNQRKPTIGITLGDINGIGPEIILKALSDPKVMEQITPVVYGAGWAWSFFKKQYSHLSIDEILVSTPKKKSSHTASLVDCPVRPFGIMPGVPSRESGEAARIFLKHGVMAAKDHIIDGLVTAPIDKSTFYGKEFPYHGHTEYLTHVFGVRDRVMIMVGKGVRIGLATEHVALKDVAPMITTVNLRSKIQLFERSLRHDFNIAEPTIAVLGLNPHAGDEALLGAEERDIIQPLIRHFQQAGKTISGPFSADGFFAAGHASRYDGVLAMYHDQGLLPFKLMAFNVGVNYTAGLPIVRTSPDHGVAYDIAGKNRAKSDSMKQAIYLATTIGGVYKREH